MDWGVIQRFSGSERRDSSGFLCSRRLDREVERMSAGRRGRPFTYPDSLIRLLASVRLLSTCLTGSSKDSLRALLKCVDGLRVPDCTTLNRRLTGLISTWMIP